MSIPRPPPVREQDASFSTMDEASDVSLLDGLECKLPCAGWFMFT